MKLQSKFAVLAAAIVLSSIFTGCSKSANQAPDEAAAKRRAIEGWAATPQEQAKANAIAAAQQAAGRGQ